MTEKEELAFYRNRGELRKLLSEMIGWEALYSHSTAPIKIRRYCKRKCAETRNRMHELQKQNNLLTNKSSI